MSILLNYFVYNSYLIIGKQIHQYEKIISFIISLPAEPYYLNSRDVETWHSKVKQLLPNFMYIQGLFPVL